MKYILNRQYIVCAFFFAHSTVFGFRLGTKLRHRFVDLFYGLADHEFSSPPPRPEDVADNKRLIQMRRREFLTATAVLSFSAMRDRVMGVVPKSSSVTKADQFRIEEVSHHCGVFHETINVGVIGSGGKVLLIDSGQGSIIDGPHDFGSIESVFYTHYHRDQCSGAQRLKSAGISIGVPASEVDFFRNATNFWSEADKVIDHRYNFRPGLMVLRESIAPDRELRPGETIDWGDVLVHIVSTPGHTDGSLSYIVQDGDNTIAFTGDLVSSAGQIWEFYSLQKRFPGMAGDYWGFGGAVEDLLASIETIRSFKPSKLIPSHGDVVEDPQGALELLRQRLCGLMKNYFTLSAWRIYKDQEHEKFNQDAPPAFRAPMLDPLPKSSLPSWLHRAAETSWYITAPDRSIFLFDCGFSPVLGALDRLIKSGEISGIEAIWVSHYHDDHVASINEVRQKFGAKVYAQAELKDILEQPRAYRMPCLFPENIHVDHVLTEGETFYWKGYKLTGYYFPGQTLYHDAILIEHDGARVLMTGDSFANWGIDDYCSYNRNFVGTDGERAGYARCLNLLSKLRPDVLCAAHWGAVSISESYVQHTRDLLTARQKLLDTLFPWDDPNFGLDPNWVVAYPFRQSCFPGEPVTLDARIYNHSAEQRRAQVNLRMPKGWSTEPPSLVTIPPHSEGRIRMLAKSPEAPSSRRQVLGLDVWFHNHHLGEIAEAIIDFLD